MTTHVLILGGTGDARRLAALLSEITSLKITLSLAGRTQQPLPHACAVRVGGFGGAEGLARYLRNEKVSILIDATHPFAARISANALAAATQIGKPLLVLERPAWQRVAGDNWIEVDSTIEAVAALGQQPRKVFLAIGRQEVAAFASASQHRYIVRSVDPIADDTLGPRADYILARGPFAEVDEIRLLTERSIEIIVSKNSGGSDTYGKITAARELGLSVIMIRRPLRESGAQIFSDPDVLVEALVHLANLPSERGE